MATKEPNQSDLLLQYLQTARKARCSWGEVEETVRQQFTDADVSALLAQHGNAANLETLYKEMGSAPAEPRHGPQSQVASWMLPYLKGKCFDFALALAEKVSNPVFVAVGDPKYSDHVAVRVSERPEIFVDVRGILDRPALLQGLRGQPTTITVITRDAVELHCGLAGFKPPYRGNKDIAEARRAVQRTFPNGVVFDVSAAGSVEGALVVDGTDKGGQFLGDGEYPPFVVFDTDSQNIIAGPFDTRALAESSRAAIMAGEQPHLDADKLKEKLAEIDSQGRKGPELYQGTWVQLFGPGRTDTECRIVVDVENDKLIAAQVFDGLKWVGLREDEQDRIADSLFDANEVSKDPGAWGLEAIESLPEWASTIIAERGELTPSGSETEVAQNLIKAPPDWKDVAEALFSAVDSLETQVEQMQGMFPDDDGLIQEALDEADEASALYVRASRSTTAKAANPADTQTAARQFVANNPNFFFYILGHDGHLTAAFDRQMDAGQYAKQDARRRVLSRSELGNLLPEFRGDFLESRTEGTPSGEGDFQTLDTMHRIKALIGEANMLMHTLPQDAMERLVQHGADNGYGPAGGFDASQVLSMAGDEFDQFLEKEESRAKLQGTSIEEQEGPSGPGM